MVTRLLSAGALTAFSLLLTVGLYYVILVAQGGGRGAIPLIAGTWWATVLGFGLAYAGFAFVVFLLLCFIPRTDAGLQKMVKLVVVALLAVAVVCGIVAGFFGQVSPDAFS